MTLRRAGDWAARQLVASSAEYNACDHLGRRRAFRAAFRSVVQRSSSTPPDGK